MRAAAPLPVEDDRTRRRTSHSLLTAKRPLRPPWRPPRLLAAALVLFAAGAAHAQDDDPLYWVARAWLADTSTVPIAASATAVVNENAPPIASPDTADPAAADVANVMYFGFYNYVNLNPRNDTVITYCLGGTATGGTAEQAAANPSQTDYIWPGNYDPDSETPGEVAFCTRGRGTFAIASDSRVHRLGITLNDDNLNEGDETITVAVVHVSEPGYNAFPDGSSATGIATRVIRDNDAIAASIAPTGADFRAGGDHNVEEGRIARFLVTLDRASAAAATVPYTVEERSSAVDREDYGAFFAIEDGVRIVAGSNRSMGGIVIPAGRTSAILAVPIERDEDTDVNEFMRIRLPEAGAPGIPWSAAGAIGPDTRAATFFRDRNEADVFIVPLIATRTLAVLRRVDAAGATTTGAVIEIGDAADAGANVHYIAGFANADDAPFDKNARVRWVVRHGDPSSPTTAATADADFFGLSGEFTMPGGATQTQFALTLAGDNLNEPTEYFRLLLEAVEPAADGGTLPAAAAVTAIADDDRVVISLGGGRRFREGETPDLIVDFGAELTRELTVRVVILRVPLADIVRRVNYDDLDQADLDTDGVTGNDWLPATPPYLARGQIGRPLFVLSPVPGATSGVIPLNFFGAIKDDGSNNDEDGINEADEVFWVGVPEYEFVYNRATESNELTRVRDIYIRGAWGDAAVAVGEQQYIIEDGDPISVSVAASTDTVAEGRSVRFHVTLEGAPGGPDADMEVLYTLSGPGGGVVPVDYGDGRGRLRFNRLQTAGVITVGIPATGALGAASMDATMTLEITGVEEVRTAPETLPGHLGYQYEYFDYALGEVSVSSTRNRASVTVDWVDGEHVFEAARSSPGAVAEGADANTTAAWVVTRTAGPDLGGGNLRLMWSAVPGAGAAAAEDADFAATTGVLTFTGSTQSAGARRRLDVLIAPDNLNEADEHFRVVFAAADAGAGIASLPPPQEAVITDSADDAIEVAITRDDDTPASAPESGTATLAFRIGLSGGVRTADVVVPFVFSGGVIAGSGLRIITPANIAAGAVSGVVTFRAGSAPGADESMNVVVQLLDDDLNEATETLTLTGAPGLRTAGAIRYADGAGSAGVEILDNDPILVSASLDSADIMPETPLVPELWKGRIARFLITMDHASAATATIPWGIGVVLVRYRGANSGVATIPAGQTTATVDIRVLDGGVGDVLIFFLSDNPGPAAAGAIRPANPSLLQTFFSPLMATRTLTVLRRVDDAGAEAAGAITETDDDLAVHYIAGLAGAGDAPFTSDTRIRWLVNHGNLPAAVAAATDDGDFAAVSGEFTMPAGATETRFTILVAGDNLNEPAETFNISLTADDAVADADGRTAFGDVLVNTIGDDDQVAITLSGGGGFAEGSTPAPVLHVDFGAELARPFRMDVEIFRDAMLAQGRALPNPENDAVDAADLDIGMHWISTARHPLIVRSRNVFMAAAGTTGASVTLDVFGDDNLNEADEMFWVSLNLDNNGAGEVLASGMDNPVVAGGAWGEAVFAVPSQAWTIVDNDPITLAVAAAATTVTEGQSVQFDVTLDSGSDGDIDVLYTLGGLDGVAPDDLGGGGRLRITRGQTAGAITAFIPPTDALGASSDSQTLTLDITGVERLPTEPVLQRSVGADGVISIVETEDRGAGAFNVSSTQGRASVTVDWVDGEHVFELTRAPAVVVEGGGDAAEETWFVTRTAGRDLGGGRLRFSWVAFPSGANAAEFGDFTSRVGDLAFRGAPGIATSQSFRVGVAADGVNEATETFTVVFAFAAGDIESAEAVGGVASLPGSHEVAIADSPADAVVVGITRDTGTPESVAEGGVAVFTVALSGGGRSADVVVPFTLSGAGITDDDFDIISPDTISVDDSGGVLVFYTGNLRGGVREEIRVRLLDDDLNEAAETLTLTGAPPGAAGLRTAGAIRYTNAAAEVSVTDDDHISVGIAVAVADADPGAAGHQVPEGGAAEFTVFLNRASAAAATIPYGIGGDVEPEDHGGGATGTVTVAAGRTTAALVIPTRLDGDTDAVETLTVSLAESGYSAAGGIGRADASTSVSVQITQLPVARTLRLVRTDAGGGAVTTSTVAEGDSGVAVHYRVGFEAGGLAFGADTGILWTVRHGDPSSATAAATGADDFAATTGAVVMAAGTTDPAAFTLMIRGDNRNEPTEHFSVSVAVANIEAAETTRPGDGVTLAIEDDDPVVITLSGGGGFAEGSTPAPVLHLDFGAELGREFEALVRVVRDAGNTGTSTIESADVSAGIEWTVSSQSPAVVSARAGMAAFRFPAGATTGAIALDFFVDDGLNEADEVFWVGPVADDAGSPAGFSGAYGAISFAAASQTYIIEDNDEIAVAVSATADTVQENRSAEFVVVLEGAPQGSDGAVEVFYSLSELTGVTLADSGGSLRFDRGSTNGVITVGIPFSEMLDADSPAQTLAFEITGVAGAPTAPTTATVGGVIVELADHAAGAVTSAAPGNRASVTVEWLDAAHDFALDSPPATIAEGAGAAGMATYVITRTGPPLADSLEIAWRLDLAGAGAEADDFIATTGAVTFNGDESRRSFDVVVAEDDLNEAAEAFAVAFDVEAAAAASAGGVSLPDAHRATITDSADDAIEATVSRHTGTPERVAEGGDAVFTITLSGGVRTADVTAPFSLSGTGIADADFDITAPAGAGAFGGEVVFGAAGALAGDSTNIVVRLLADGLNEAAETLTLTGAAAGATGLRTAGGAIRYSAAAGATTATVVIADNDPLNITLSGGRRFTEGAAPLLHLDFGAELSREFEALIRVVRDAGNPGTNTIESADVSAGVEWATAQTPAVLSARPGAAFRFPAGATTGAIALDFFVDDGLNEADEVFWVGPVADDAGLPTGFSGAYGAISFVVASQTYIIGDNDDIAVSVSAATNTVSEGHSAEFVVVLEGAPQGPDGAVDVFYNLSGLTGVTPADSGGSLRLDRGSTNAVVTVAIPFSDLLGGSDPAQTLTFEITGVAGVPTGPTTGDVGGDLVELADHAAGAITSTAPGNRASVEVEWADAAHIFTLAGAPAGIDEGAGAANMAAYTVLRAGPDLANRLEIAWSLDLTGAATADADDFTGATGGVLAFSGGITSQTFRIGVAADDLNEADEDFNVVVAVVDAAAATSAGGVSLPGAHRTVIADNDPLNITLSGGRRFTEGAAPRLNLDFGAVLSREFEALIRVVRDAGNPDTSTIESADVSAVAEWTVSSQTPAVVSARAGMAAFRFAPGARTGAIALDFFADDGLNEADEVFWVEPVADDAGLPIGFSGAYGAISFAAASQTYIIADNDEIVVSVSAVADTVSEGRSAEFAVVLQGAPEGSDGDIDVLYRLSGLTGVTLADTGGSLRIDRGSTNGVAAIAIPFSDALGAGSVAQTLAFEITGVAGAPTAPTTGGAGGDIIELADHAAGAITSTAPGNRASVAVEWTDAAHVFTLAGAPDAVAEDSGEPSTATYIVTRTGPPLTNRVGIAWRLDLTGAATAGAEDFSGATTGVAAFSGGVTSQTFRVVVAADNLNEAGEDFRIVLDVADAAAATSAGGVSLPGAHRTTIIDNADDAIVATVSRDAGTPESVAEGGDAVFRITLSGGVRTAAVVAPFELSGTGVTDADFDITAPAGAGAFGGEVVFGAAGALAGDSTNIVVRLLDDNLNEAAETLMLTGVAAGAVAGVAGLRTAGGAIRYSAAAGATTAAVVIADNDPITATFAPRESAVQEGRTAALTVLLDKPGAAAVTVPYTVSAGGISPPSFTDATAGRISIAANTTGGVIRLEVLRNSLRTATGTLTVAFGTLTTGGAGGAVSGAGEAVITVAPPFDMLPPMLEGLAWNGGLRALWLRTNDPYKVLPYPDGALLPGGTPSLTTLAEEDFSVIENNGLASQATLTVMSVRAIPQNRAFELTLERAIADAAANVWVAYRRTGANAIYDTALEEGGADPLLGRNALPNQGPFMLPRTGDADSDGMPDAVEIAIGENPLEVVAAERQPAFSLSRTATPNPVAYSGIREHGVLAHLGVSSETGPATPTAARTIIAYYRSDTFGYDGGYRCADGPFPVNHGAALSQGGCAPVDWGDIRPGVDHRIAWLARSGDGVWKTERGTTSHLPEQVIRRIPELNMDAQRLFTTGVEVVVGASFDTTPGETLTLVLTQTPDAGGARTRTTGGAGRTLSFTDASPVSALWEIADVTAGGAPGGASRLYRAATATANHPAANEYSLGLARRTRVTRINAPPPPVFGSAVLLLNSTPVAALADGNAAAYTLDVPVENRGGVAVPGVAGAVTATHNGTLAGITAAGFIAGTGGVGGRYRFTFTLKDGLLAAATMTQAVIQAVIGDGFGGVTTATYRFPVVARNAPLAARRADGDRDGIADEFDAFDDSGHLPVAVDGAAGANAWHHIRLVFPWHTLRLGETTFGRLAGAGAEGANEYADYSASQTPADAGLAVVYDFEIGGVGYSEVSTDGRTGGVAGVIIPLPRSLYNSGVSLVKVPLRGAFSVAGGNDYGFAPLQNGACPDDTMAAGSPYREGETLRRAKRAGDACLVVYLVDGGPNDEDGTANGVVKDPLGLRTGGAGVVGGGGGATGPAALVVLLLALSLVLARLRRGGRRRGRALR